jgi:hypothetical protein
VHGGFAERKNFCRGAHGIARPQNVAGKHKRS